MQLSFKVSLNAISQVTTCLNAAVTVYYILQDRGKTRARSMQDMSLVLANKARDTRSVSFNGVVAMVDAALHLNSVSADRRNELYVAVNENKIDVLRCTNLFKFCQFFQKQTYFLQTCLNAQEARELGVCESEIRAASHN